MEKLTLKQKIDWLKFRYKMYLYSSILDVPVLILLYWLGYMTGFWILLIMKILGSFGFAHWTNKKEKEFGLD